MSDQTPTTELHKPITNLKTPEKAQEAAQVSPGSIGLGDVVEVAKGALVEPTPPVAMELAFEGFTEMANSAVPAAPILQDIAVASFGPPPPVLEAVIGTDERVQILKTGQYPWRVNASLLITGADNSQWVGTGWFISPRTLITAGHCVYIKNSGVPGRDGWVKKIQVMPGRNGTEQPFGSSTATEFWSVVGWGEKGLENYDYGAIILPEAFPQDLGYYGFGVFEDETLKAATMNIAGYPADKPRGTLWYDHREVASVNPDKVFYAADTAGGQSGACVYFFYKGERTAIAIHAYGGNTANSGTRISPPVFANLEAWKRT